MKVTIFQRVMQILNDKQISVNALSKMINMSQTTLNTQLKGERALAATVVEKVLLAFPDVSAEWVMRGVGSMYNDGGSTANMTAIAANEPSLATDPVQVESESIWQAKYEELEKRYDQLLSILGGGMRQSKVNVG